MIALVLLLIPVAAVISLPLTAALILAGHRLGTFDGPGSPGHVKAAARRVPNTGGIAITVGIVLPIAAALLALRLVPAGDFPAWAGSAVEHVPRLLERTPDAIALLLAIVAVHVLGVIDDRRALGPSIKLLVMTAVATALVLVTDSRLLVLLDACVGGAWLSIVITVAWLVGVTNAFNFIDNMDGLAGGVAAIASGCFLAAALIHRQWLVGAVLALLIGAVLGFLVFNRPPARIFMGDGGSLVLGLVLAFLTVRTTYVSDDNARAGEWYGVLMPLVVLAVPLYDFASVTILRLSQRRSPFVGDMQHLSHRMVGLGLSRAAAVGVICGLTAITGLSGVILGSLEPWQAVLVGIQTVLTLLVLAAFEHAAPRRGAGP